MVFRALIAMITADAIDRHTRERQYQAWLTAAQARTAIAARATASEQLGGGGFDPLRPERPIGANLPRT